MNTKTPRVAKEELQVAKEEPNVVIASPKQPPAVVSAPPKQEAKHANAAPKPEPEVVHAAEPESEPEPYWMDEDWVPTTKAGKQRTPNMIRNELQRYIDASGRSKASVMRELDVNSKSFQNFMNPNYYKNQWSAVDNGTYWAAARFLEVERTKPKPKKRKAADGASSDSPSKKSRKEAADQLIAQINAVELDDRSQNKVYDSCPELVKKIKAFLTRDGVTKKGFCDALGGINANSLNRFLAAKKQDGCGNCTYKAAYVFFEKLRLLEKLPKSKKRLQNEREQPNGFALQKPPLYTWVYVGPKK